LACSAPSFLVFGPYRLDLLNQQLWREQKLISLKPKAFQVLAYLATHSGQLVRKRQLLDELWPETHVGEAVLKVAILDIRKALNDTVRTPQFIETVHRRGYRFRAPVRAEGGSAEQIQSQQTPRGAPSQLIVGREQTFKHLRNLAGRALEGERQLIFLTGAPGIGKSTVLRAFCDEIRGLNFAVAEGVCFEHFGSPEAYYPVLDAITGLATEVGRDQLVSHLDRFAPTWLSHLPSLARPHPDRVLVATRERMLRELAEFLEALSGSRPLAFVLEDLHWSDHSTMDLLSSLASRSGRARLVLISSFRPVEAIISHHPVRRLARELQARDQAVELPLELLTKQAVAQYLQRMLEGAVSASLVQSFYARTGGNPLFLANILAFARAQEMIAPQDGVWTLTVCPNEFDKITPEGVRQTLARQVERLDPPERLVLEAGAVVGTEFTSAEVAAALHQDVAFIETHCEALAARQQFITGCGIARLRTGLVSGRYAFLHTLYGSVLYEAIPEARRARMHARLVEYLERQAERRPSEDSAAALVRHSLQGHDYRRAITYLEVLAHRDLQRFAPADALDKLQQAFQLAVQVGDQETVVRLREQIGLARRSRGDMAGAAAELAHLTLDARRQNNLELEARALLHQASALSWIDRDGALQAAATAASLAPRIPNVLLRTHVLGYAGYWRFLLDGWRDEDARASAEAIEAARQAGDAQLLSLHLGRHSLVECLRSEYARALEIAREGMQRATSIAEPFDLMLCHFSGAWALLHLGQWGQMLDLLDRAEEVAERNGHDLWHCLFEIERGWLHQRAFDYQRSLEICHKVLPRAREARHQPSLFLARVLESFALLGLRRLAEAREAMQAIVSWSASQRVLMDWMWLRQLYYGLAVLAWACDDMAGAESWLQRLLQAATEPVERTLLGLGWRLHVLIAQKLNRPAEAHHGIQQALRWVGNGCAPLAAWQVYEVAALLHEGEASRRYWESAADVLEQLRTSLGSRYTMAMPLLKSPRVAQIFARCERPLDRLNS
jgi:DNA-binding winged helix-turn-helix (wHTH) protein/tetratricopeptide (TPR) repeat protein